jgi:Leucine-rich repeat (LRR) protein
VKAILTLTETVFSDSGDLTKLHCNGDDGILLLPKLPNKLSTLDCGGTQITSLPELPSGLRELDCGNTRITSLFELPVGLEGSSLRQLSKSPRCQSSQRD